MGSFIGILIVIAFFLPLVEGLLFPRHRRKKKSNQSAGEAGCLLLIGFVVLLGLALQAIDFVKAHSAAVFLVGILVVFIGLIAFMVNRNDKANSIGSVSSGDSTRENTKETRRFSLNQKRTFAATPEEIVGTIPSAKEIAGKIGEDAVSRAVYTACQFDKRHYKILRNVYIPQKRGNYTEVDVLLLHETGVYVFESKNLSGSVYGDMDHLQWQRYKKNGDKEFIPNPIRQNEGHIRALCEYLNQNKYQFRVFSMIVFGTKSNLKFVPEDTSLMSIHDIYNLEMDLIKKMQSRQSFYSANTIDAWCKKLLPCTMLSEEEKQKHKDSITRRFNKIN